MSVFVYVQIKTWSVTSGNKGMVWKDTKTHAVDSPILSICVHPSSKVYVACTARSWIMVDIESENVITTVDAQNGTGLLGSIFLFTEFTLAQFHPDGLLLAVGCTRDSAIEVYDVKTLEMATKFSGEAGDHAVTSLDFCENGYFLASATAVGANVWDLRNQSMTAQLAPTVPDEASGEFRVCWDGYGMWLAVYGRGTTVNVWQVKKWDSGPVATWDIGARGLGCAWTDLAETAVFAGSDGKYLVVS